MKKHWKEIAAAVILLGLINMVYFLIPFKHTMNLLIGDGFTCAGFGMLIYAIYLSSVWKDTRSRFFGWPVLRTGIRFFGGVFVLNLFWILLTQFLFVPTWLLILTNCVLLGTECLMLLGIDGGRNFVETQKQKREQRMDRMNQLCEKIGELEMKCEDSFLLEAIVQLQKKFRYSDPNSSKNSDEIEEKIWEELNELEENLNTDTEKDLRRIEKIGRMLNFRNQQIIQGK